MRMGRNLFAGLTNSAWTAIITFATVPLYLKFLGVEAYGLIGFFATTQALLQLLDLGLAPTINREVARHSASGDMRGAATTLHTLALVYWGMAALIALVFLLVSQPIAEFWLGENALPPATTANAVLFTGLIIACRWPMGLYRGALLGAQRLAMASAINIAMVTLSNLGAVVILAFVSATTEAFFAWQLLVSICHLIVLRLVTWKIIGFRQSAALDFNTLKRIWKFSAGMAGVAATGILLAQLDKVLLSNLLTLENFAHYTLAGLVASGLYVLLTPTFNVVYPRFSVLVVEDDIQQLEKMYHTGTRLLTAVLFPIAISAAFFARDLLYLWTGNPEVAVAVEPIVQLTLIGTALNGAMHFPYALQLAYGVARLPLLINLVLIAIFIPLVLFLVARHGALGGAMAWLCVNSLYLFIGSWITHRTLLPGAAANWLVKDVGIPFIVTCAIVVPGGNWVLEGNYSLFINLFFAATLAVLATAAIAIILLGPTLKQFFNRQIARPRK